MEGFVLVTAEGGLINEVVFYEEEEPAIRMAEHVWSQMNAEADDLKVFDLKENIVWSPPQEEGSEDGTG